MDITTNSGSDKQTANRRRHANTMVATTTNSMDCYLQDCQQPSSPASSSTSTSQTTGDTTFEPSIDMMVNDFDDEQTLTEEEALAELEAQNPADEIATLQKESEIPLEELLAHYKQHVEQGYQYHRRQKKKKIAKKSRSRKQQSKNQTNSNSICTTIATNLPPITTIDEVIVIEESDDEVELLKTENFDTDAAEDGSAQDAQEEQTTCDGEDGDDEDGEFGEEPDDVDGEVDFTGRAVDFSKRSHLLELYPEKFTNIYHKMDDDFSDDDDEDDDEFDYVKRTIMVGSFFQAVIPIGLSKYGDVLPYENEDKLIWEPSQVSEQEVEDYLLRVREIKSSTSSGQEEEIPSSSASVTSESDLGLGSSLVKDDEQALHLLVQCGYNFKEALRRKRLNAVPLTGSMSLWSEEECRNFEEGIQKYGKDFRKIRQTQVRTRSIRELVQFYYLWKKTDRRDQDFIDSDTIDHMDIYLDFDERDTSSNGGGKQITSSSLTTESFITNQTFPTKRLHHASSASSNLSNFSIMNETKRLTACSNHSKKSSGHKKSHSDCHNKHSAYRRRRSSLLAAANNKSHQHGENNSIFNNKKKCTLESPSHAGSKVWRNNSAASSTMALPTISSTTGNHCGKK